MDVCHPFLAQSEHLMAKCLSYVCLRNTIKYVRVAATTAPSSAIVGRTFFTVLQIEESHLLAKALSADVLRNTCEYTTEVTQA